MGGPVCIFTRFAPRPSGRALGGITRMNVFTTDHPMVSQHSLHATRKDLWVSYSWSILTVAFILCPLFLGVTWLGMGIAETPDMPDPSAAPSVLELILTAGSFIISFPAYLFLQADEPFGLTEKILIYTGVGFDGLFWAFASVSLHRFLAWHFQKKPIDT